MIGSVIRAARPWAGDAACRGEDPELFHPDSVDDVAEAVAICERCPVQAACLDHALRHEIVGVWGGTSARKRARMRKALGITFESLDPTDPAVEPAVAEHLEAS